MAWVASKTWTRCWSMGSRMSFYFSPRIRKSTLGVMAFGVFAGVQATPPPVRHPLACTPIFCIDVASRAPYFPQEVRSSFELEHRNSALVVQLENNVEVAFHSVIRTNVDQRGRAVPIQWKYSNGRAVASGCLDCGSTRNRNPGRIFMGIVVSPVPSEFNGALSQAIEVCVWPVSMEPSPGGPKDHLVLGDKICVSR